MSNSYDFRTNVPNICSPQTRIAGARQSNVARRELRRSCSCAPAGSCGWELGTSCALSNFWSCKWQLRIFRGPPAQNLTFKIKFAAANKRSKFEKFCQIFSAHPTNICYDQPHRSTNWNLNKCKNSIIIYIESERENKSFRFEWYRISPSLFRRTQRKIIWKVLKIPL